MAALTSHTLSVLVNDHPGVLARVSDFFGSRGYNIDKLTVGTYKHQGVSRIKISTSMDERAVDQVMGQLEELMDVISVRAMRHRVAQSKTLPFWLVAYGLFITLLGTNIPAPLYALYRAQWNLSAGMITLIFAAYALVVIPTIIISGQLSDRIGRKKLLIPGVLFSLIGSILFALSDGLSMLLFSRMLQGVSVGMLNGVAVAAMTEYDEKHSRTKSAFVAALAVTLGNAIGPVISGFLGEYGPYPMQLSYFIHVIVAIPAVLGLMAIREQKRTVATASRLHAPTVPAAIRRPFALAAVTSFIAWSIMSLMLSIIPSYFGTLVGQSNLSLSGTVIALVLGLSTLHQIMLKKRRIPALIGIGYLFLALGLIAMVVTLVTKSLLFLLLTTVFIGLGHGPTYAGALAQVNQVAPDSARGDVVSSFFVVTYLGVSIPILGLGFAAQWIGLTAAIEIFAVAMGALIVWSLVAWRRS
ncbi:acetolactate synthase small subunit [Brevibacillus fluminis]|uniref:acetolactate synthase small subunit n=1 Tax=Brevibacillus fluminis TaxID=511487 RepID=UPI00160587FF|nr:acetolactate synthase small subunit [Brevibacillus fluminis]